MNEFSELTYKEIAERLAHYLSSALVSAQYSMTDETMHDALGLCNQVTQRKAAPVPPAGDVEVLGSFGSHVEDGIEVFNVHIGESQAAVLVDRAHATRLQAVNAALQARLTVADQRVDDLQVELTKALELPPFAAKVISKLQRYEECTSDSQGADIGRHWFDLLTRLGLLNRVQRSPALWEITQQGEDLLAHQSAPAAKEK